MSDWKDKFPKEGRYFETNNGILYYGDCLKLLPKFEKRSIDLIIADPPYGINKDKWDYFKTKKLYLNFMESFFIEIEKVMKLNGTFYWFHIDMETISELMMLIKNKTILKFIQFIVWNKRFENSKNKEYLKGFLEITNLKTFPTMAEYILKYRIDIGQVLRQKRKSLKIPQSKIASEIKSKGNKVTGWYSNIETGKYYPNFITIKPIKKYLGFDLKDLLPTFNNQKTHHSVWNYDFEERKIGHITPKPISLIKNILIHSSNEGDLVLDPFLGSGTTAIACERLNRRWVGIEINEEYCELIKNRLNKETKINYLWE